MRTVKFRAWTNNSWINKGMLYDYQDTVHIETYGFNNDELPVMQFTGLLDRNGKEIYEGDIILCDRTYWDEKKKLIVEYDVQSAAFYLLNKKDSVDSETFEITSCFCVGIYEREVIGNIFENTELLSITTAVL